MVTGKIKHMNSLSKITETYYESGYFWGNRCVFLLLEWAIVNDLANLFGFLETCELVVFDATAVGTEKEGMLNGQSWV